jgi:oligopeptide/dipeptide ABC transporter ATP-binding protein
MKNNILIEITGLKKYFPIKKGIFQKIVGQIKAVDNLNFTIRAGETLGLVGESGCGKSTTGQSILRLLEPTEGSINIYIEKHLNNGKNICKYDLTNLEPKELIKLRKEIQYIFQDPYSSFNPRKNVKSILSEPFLIHGYTDKHDIKNKINDLLLDVGLKPDHLERYPHEFSGGQRQRIGIARAIALKPCFIVADEPVSSLDVSIQSQIINLLKTIQAKYRLTYLFISHDLSVIKYLSDTVAVMYLGKIIEMANNEDLFCNPKHPYTESLMSAVPIPNPKHIDDQILLKGDVPSPANPPNGCFFHPRCKYAKDICKKEYPTMQTYNKNHYVFCHYSSTLQLRPLNYNMR